MCDRKHREYKSNELFFYFDDGDDDPKVLFQLVFIDIVSLFDDLLN